MNLATWDAEHIRLSQEKAAFLAPRATGNNCSTHKRLPGFAEADARLIAHRALHPMDGFRLRASPSQPREFANAVHPAKPAPKSATTFVTAKPRVEAAAVVIPAEKSAKRCPRCSSVYPRDKNHFGVCNSNWDRVGDYCTDCRRARVNEASRLRRERQKEEA